MIRIVNVICYNVTMLQCYVTDFISRVAFSVLSVNCYQWWSCVGGYYSAFTSLFGHMSPSHDNTRWRQVKL